jgi:hypothetical protein
MKKNLVYTLSLCLLFGIVLAFQTTELVQAKTLTIGQEQSSLDNQTQICGDITTVTLFAGQTIDAGTVSVWNDADNLYVQFSTTGGWVINETHVHVGATADDIPQRNGNPIPGRFDYKTTHEPPVEEYTYTIPLDGFAAGDSLVVAAHAALSLLDENGNVIQQETGWGDGPGFPGRNWATYIEFTVQSCDENEGEGCTLTQGYWRTHSQYGPAPYDPTWAAVGENTPFFSSGETWYSALWVSPEGDAYYILAQQYIASVLNVNNGASTTPEVDEAMAAALDWFINHNPGVPASSADGQDAVALSVILDDYNNGLIGPGHCE